MEVSEEIKALFDMYAENHKANILTVEVVKSRWKATSLRFSWKDKYGVELSHHSVTLREKDTITLVGNPDLLVKIESER